MSNEKILMKKNVVCTDSLSDIHGYAKFQAKMRFHTGKRHKNYSVGVNVMSLFTEDYLQNSYYKF